MSVPFEDLERIYEHIAEAIDRAGPENEALFLTKLALLLAHRHADAEAFTACVQDALANLSEGPNWLISTPPR